MLILSRRLQGLFELVLQRLQRLLVLLSSDDEPLDLVVLGEVDRGPLRGSIIVVYMNLPTSQGNR